MATQIGIGTFGGGVYAAPSEPGLYVSPEPPGAPPAAVITNGGVVGPLPGKPRVTPPISAQPVPEPPLSGVPIGTTRPPSPLKGQKTTIISDTVPQIHGAAAMAGAPRVGQVDGYLPAGGDYFLDNIWMQGPGVKEPHPAIVAKQWSIVMDSKQGDFRLVFYRLRDGRVLCYNQRTGIWKKWRPAKMVVIGKKLPSHRTMVRLRSYLKRHKDDAKQILQITQPSALTTYAAGKGRVYRKKR